GWRRYHGRMAPHLTRWPHPEPPSTQALLALYHAEGLAPSSWSNGPGDRYSEHEHSYAKLLFCAAGSIRFLVRGVPFDLTPADRLELPPHTPHAAVVGPGGVT